MIGDELAVRDIKIKHKILLMTKYGEDILCVLNENDQFHLCVVDKNIEDIIKTILKDDETLFSYPGFIDVSADKNTFYVLDYYKGCYGITLEGQVAFQYQNPEAECYFGLVVNTDGLLIGSGDNDECQVEKLTFSGEREEVCIIFGKSYPLKVVENVLVIFNVDDNKSHCIRFYCQLQ